MARADKVGTLSTTVATTDGTTRVTYHSTVVVEFNTDRITLRTGGWRTSTTKARMTQTAAQFHLGYRIHTRAGAWFVTTPRGDVLPFEGAELSFTRAGELVRAT
jgi:hypothetical protein